MLFSVFVLIPYWHENGEFMSSPQAGSTDDNSHSLGFFMLPNNFVLSVNPVLLLGGGVFTNDSHVDIST